MAGEPWLDYAAPAPADAGPWTDYAAPVNPVTDVAKSAVSGVGSGLTGLVGLPGDLVSGVGHLVKRAIEYAAPPKTTPEEHAKIEQEFWQAMNNGAGVDVAQPMTSAEIQKGVEQATGPFYEPQTTG